MLITLLCVAMAVALAVPGTTVGAFLRGLLVELPVRMLSKLTPARITFGVFVILMIAGLIALAKDEGLMITVMSFPEGLAWFAAFDVTAFVDLIGGVLLVAGAVRFRAVYRALCAAAARAGHLAARFVARVRHRLGAGARDRARRGQAKASPPATDDEDWPQMAFSVSQAFG